MNDHPDHRLYLNVDQGDLVGTLDKCGTAQLEDSTRHLLMPRMQMTIQNERWFNSMCQRGETGFGVGKVARITQTPTLQLPAHGENWVVTQQHCQ